MALPAFRPVILSDCNPSQESFMHDLVIRGGTVVDGTGSAPRLADVAIAGDRIVEVGSDIGPGAREIDAAGKIVAPGWVDIHTHYDGQVTWDTHMTPSGWNGVTTVVMGNCGVGFAPVRVGQQAYLIQLMEGVEDIPGSALADGIEWEWETFSEYLDAIEKRPHAIDFAAQVPHGPVRTYVMGDRGARNEKATPDDIEAMAEIVKDGLEAGALGFSTSRTMLHRAKDGELVPGTSASEDELLGIGRMLGEVGHGVFQIASDLLPPEDELRWMRKLTRETGRPISFACQQNSKVPTQWREMLEECEREAKLGGQITPQVAQRPVGLLLGFETSIHPFIFFQGYQAIASLPVEERAQRLADPLVRASILDNPPDMSHYKSVVAIVARGFKQQFPLCSGPGSSLDYEPLPDKSIASIAEREGRTPHEVAYDIMLEGGGKGLIYLPLLDYTDGSHDNMREMMMHPLSVFGLSDGGAHCGMVSDASIPTYLLTHWVRDRTRGERIPIEQVVSKQTKGTAEFFGIQDRGVLAPGMKADVNVIDLEALEIHPPEVVYDLPADSRRIVQRVDGYCWTICSGEVIYEGGKPTGALPGKLIRGPQPAPSQA
jgi:N-acyl-D-amino-acid deacylase